MRPRFIRLSPKKAQEFSALKREAERDGAHRVARRLHAVLLNHQQHTSGEIARLLEAPRSKVSLWLQKFQTDGWKALLEGHRPGRPQELNAAEWAQLDDIIDSGPVAYGFTSGVWTSPMIAQVIAEEFAVHYHPGHVRKVLKAMGFSVQRPRRQLAKADPVEQDRWQRYTYPRLKKTADRQAALLFADEASFRQDPSLYQTWARRGQQPLIPTTGQRNTRKIFGAVDLYRPQFYYGLGEVFEGQSYTAFLDGLAQRYRRQEVFLIQDNAAYHRAPEVREWLTCYGHRFHLCPLPKYSPEFNAVEPLWHYVRMQATHNRYYATESEFAISLEGTLCRIARQPSQIQGYWNPFL
jgi:transposase